MTFVQKARENLWIILTISLINYSIAVAFSILVHSREEPALISLLAGAILCFFVS